MFFASDKDLRKAVPKKAIAPKPKVKTADLTETPIILTSSTNVVEQAKAEREQRQLKRDLAKHASLIQAWWRGRSISCTYYTKQLAVFDSKISDIDKLNKLLTSKGLPNLVAPPEICINLLSILHVVSLHSKRDCSLQVVQSVQLLLIPTLSQLDPLKNLMLILYKKDNTILLSGIFKLIMDCLLRTVATRGATQLQLASAAVDSLCECLSLLLGRGEPYKIKNTTKHLSSRPSVDCVSDKLFGMCLFLLQADGSASQDRLTEFVQTVWSVPMLTLVLSADCLQRLCGDCGLLSSMLNLIAVPSEVHFPAHVRVDHVISSHQWVLGNTASLLGAMRILHSEQDRGIDVFVKDDLLITYLTVCAQWLAAHMIPGVLQGREGIVWKRSGGTNFTAVGVPAGLEEQVLVLLDCSGGSLHAHTAPCGGGDRLGGAERQQGQDGDCRGARQHGLRHCTGRAVGPAGGGDVVHSQVGGEAGQLHPEDVHLLLSLRTGQQQQQQQQQ